MRDEQDREAEPLLQVLQEGQDLRLHGDVERRDRLVGDEHLGFERERAGDADALALAAGEFVRVAVERGRRCRPTRSSRSRAFAMAASAWHALRDRALGDDAARPCGAG